MFIITILRGRSTGFVSVPFDSLRHATRELVNPHRRGNKLRLVLNSRPRASRHLIPRGASPTHLTWNIGTAHCCQQCEGVRHAKVRWAELIQHRASALDVHGVESLESRSILIVRLAEASGTAFHYDVQWS